ncbi:hypothetical protein AVEN_211884-1 [Araneus ventricosus]|uniref:BESS domain-containing protein n=1 Tax=Araneus ventricosus TaxID=182803 RepID=A0A4Y2F0Q2_ARAVE|nr:hypothetical protein AVEN_211884-1 [Araneus ventricosus]
MVEVREEDIYNEVLIYEVQSRPALYDKSYKEYTEPTAKAKLWEEVTMKVYSTVWRQLPPEQKLLAGNLIQRRWTNLRSSFTRDLRRQQLEKLGQSKKRRRYRHFDDLLFLLPFLQDKELRENFEAQAKNRVPRQLRTSGRNLATETEVKGEEVEILLHAESIEKEAPEVHNAVVRSPKNKKKKNYVEYQPDILPERNGTDFDINDSDRYFALSLVPLLKPLAPHQKLEAQIQILQVFRNFHNQPPL